MASASRRLMAGLLLCACEASIRTPAVQDTPLPDGPQPVALVAPTLCPTPTQPAPTVQLRLTRGQYLNAIAALLPAGAVAAAAAELASLPQSRAGRFSSQQAEVSTSEVDAYHAVAFKVAFEVADHPSQLGALEPCLASTPISASCVQTFLARFGRRAFRRPMGAADLQHLLRAYQLGSGTSPEEGVGAVLYTVLTDFEFLYRVEHSGTRAAGPGEVWVLTDHELASRLAFALWDAPPDDALLDAADRGLDGAALSAELDRLLADPRARPTLARFYTEWLGVTASPTVPAYLKASDPAALGAAVRRELEAFVTRVTLDEQGSYRDLMTRPTAVIDEPQLAALYGLPPSAVGQVVTLPAAERAGVLTRAGWLFTPAVKSSNAGHVIKRGVRFSEVLCRPLPPPDPNLFPPDNPADPATAPGMTIRERFGALTAQAQCKGCHVRLDSWGGAFGRYGSAGQHLDGEVVFDAAFAPTQTLTIDASAQADLDETLEPRVDGALELSARLGESLSGPQCLAKQLSTHLSGRGYTPAEGCWVEAASQALQRGSIRSAIVALLTAPELRLKAHAGVTP